MDRAHRGHAARVRAARCALGSGHLRHDAGREHRRAGAAHRAPAASGEHTRRARARLSDPTSPRDDPHRRRVVQQWFPPRCAARWRPANSASSSLPTPAGLTSARCRVPGMVGQGPGCPVGGPADCPATNSGQTLSFENSARLDACPWLRDRQNGACSATCVPVAIAGRTIGVLHVTAPPDAPPDGHDGRGSRTDRPQGGRAHRDAPHACPHRNRGSVPIP